jgi:enamine deaminase RidA (YjgF/YER057c/UK114 family)
LGGRCDQRLRSQPGFLGLNVDASRRLDRCLKAAAATWADVVKTNTFVTDFDEFQKYADIRMRYLGVANPTTRRSVLPPSRRSRFMIEIEAVAIVNS